MKINSIALLNVRNHIKAAFSLPEEVIFTGPNGSGKTTVLESIYLLLAMRGFKKQPLSGVVSFDKPFMRINAEKEERDLKYDLSLKYDGKKHLLKNGSPAENISDYIFSSPAACYTPESPGILNKEQSERRSFIDRFVFYAEKRHIDDIKIYNRLITQKTAEIYNNNPNYTYLEVLNEEIIRLSMAISTRRKNLISKINEGLEKIYNEAPFKIEPVFISYKTNINDCSIFEKEKKTKRCEYGIHRDKADMSLNGKLIEKFSSFGQKKTFAMLSLLEVIKYIEETRKISIITLLDDFEAGLDRKRAGFLKERFSEKRQTIYTGVEDAKLSFKNTINL